MPPRSQQTETDARLILLLDAWQGLRDALGALAENLDADAIHDTRVCVRRLRALLRALHNEIHPTAYAELQFDLKSLARDLAGVRGADVHGALIEDLLKADSDAATKDRHGLQLYLHRHSEAARRSLARRIGEPRWTARLERITQSLHTDGLLLRPLRPAECELKYLLASSLNDAIRMLKKKKIGVRALHKQRIRIKNARYVLETVAPRLRLDARRVESGLHKTQDALGDLHDLSTLIDWLRDTSLPTPLLDPLIDHASIRYADELKRYRRMQPTVRKRLAKVAKAVAKV